MQYGKLWLLPLFFPAISLVTFAIVYPMAVVSGHVEAALPYISDIGTLPKESCVFSFMADIALMFLILTIYVRHLHISTVQSDTQPNQSWCNWTATAFGAVGCTGMCLLANFQKVFCNRTHLVGAGFYFIGIGIYIILQTHFSRTPKITPFWTFICRIIVCVLIAGSNVTSLACGLAAKNVKKNDSLKSLKWHKGESGWELHVASVACQWFVVICHCAFIASLAIDLRGYTLDTSVLSAGTAAGAKSSEQ